MQQYLTTSSIEELNSDLQTLVVELQQLHKVIAQLSLFQTKCESVVVYPSIELGQPTQVRLELQLHPTTPVVSVSYSNVLNGFLFKSGLLDEPKSVSGVDAAVAELHRLYDISEIVHVGNIFDEAEVTMEDTLQSIHDLCGTDED